MTAPPSDERQSRYTWRPQWPQLASSSVVIIDTFTGQIIWRGEPAGLERLLGIRLTEANRENVNL